MAEFTLERREHLSANERLEVLGLLDRLEAELEREAIDEGRRRAVVHDRPAVHWLERDGGVLVGYAQVGGSDPVTVEMAGGGFNFALYERIAAEANGVDWWVRDVANLDTPGVMRRRLHLLVVDLPVPPAPVPEGITVRPFEPGRDNAAWLQQNNAAFADHPEQGAWRDVDLQMRLGEPWFDPSGFLLFVEGERIVASCWTKVHELSADRIGEIYVISVDPSAQGRGLGKIAVTQGLDRLRGRGVSRAMLFVDDTNVSARGLYQRLGFTSLREDRLIGFD